MVVITPVAICPRYLSSDDDASVRFLSCPLTRDVDDSQVGNLDFPAWRTPFLGL